MKLKIKRHEYDIDSGDSFMDNGACVQLLTQSKEKSGWGRRPNPVLSKKAIKEISKYDHIYHEHNYSSGVKIFSLGIENK